MEIQEIIKTFGIPVTYLNPIRLKPINGRNKSKMGGSEAYTIEEIDKCQFCKCKMTLIIELFKEEFEEAYFPENENYLQVKTCYNEDCPFDCEIEFKIAFGNSQNLPLNTEFFESHIPPIYFDPKSSFEIPYN